MCHSALCGINCFPSGLFLGNPVLTAIMQFPYRGAVLARVWPFPRPAETQAPGKDIRAELELKFHLLI